MVMPVSVARSERLAGCGLTWLGDGVLVAGEIDHGNADILADRLCVAIADTVRLVDLTAVTFFGAAGIRLLVSIAAAARNAGVTVRVNCSPVVRRVIGLCGVIEIAGLALLDGAGAHWRGERRGSGYG